MDGNIVNTTMKIMDKVIPIVKRGRGRPKKIVTTEHNVPVIPGNGSYNIDGITRNNNIHGIKDIEVNSVISDNNNVDEKPVDTLECKNSVLINGIVFIKIDKKENIQEPIVKRGRGRPKKNSSNDMIDNNIQTNKTEIKDKKTRGRPKKIMKYIIYKDKHYVINKDNIVRDYYLDEDVGSWNNSNETIDYNSDYYTDTE
jgi:hypothetical protein